MIDKYDFYKIIAEIIDNTETDLLEIRKNEIIEIVNHCFNVDIEVRKIMNNEGLIKLWLNL